MIGLMGTVCFHSNKSMLNNTIMTNICKRLKQIKFNYNGIKLAFDFLLHKFPIFKI